MNYYNLYKFFAITVYFVSTSFISYSQNNTPSKDQIKKARDQFDAQYGYDQDLYNGKKYYPEHTTDVGHSFWKEDKLTLGKLKYANASFDSIYLKYNIYQQYFTILHTNYNYVTSQIVLDNNKIDTIWMDNKTFVKNDYPSIKNTFIQILQTGNVSCYYSWRKEYSFESSSRYSGHIYSHDLRSCYIVVNGNIIKYQNNRSFVKAFPKSERHSISKYISSNKLNVKTNDDNKIKSLIQYCNNPKND